MHADALTPSPYLRAADFGTSVPKFPTLTIRATVIEKVASLKPGAAEDAQERKGVIYFSDEPNGLGWVINKTNKELLKALFGVDTDDWIGKRVTLEAVMVQVGPKKDLGIRVKGSPDIDHEITVPVKLPKRKAQVFKLIPTGRPANPPRPTPSGNAPDPDLAAFLAELQNAAASGRWTADEIRSMIQANGAAKAADLTPDQRAAVLAIIRNPQQGVAEEEAPPPPDEP